MGAAGHFPYSCPPGVILCLGHVLQILDVPLPVLLDDDSVLHVGVAGLESLNSFNDDRGLCSHPSPNLFIDYLIWGSYQK